MGEGASGRRSRRAGATVLVLLLALLGLGLANPAGSAARSTGARHLRYVALGDSYTSAPLVLPHDTRWVPQDCGQSVFDYPHLVAQAIRATSFVDVSCGGATFDKLTEPQGLPLASVARPQLEAVTPDTDVVTMGMGGNDVGFVGVATDCIRLLVAPLQPGCTPPTAGTPSDPVLQKIERTEVELGRAIEAIRARAPRAAIFVVGYPAALPDDAVACWPYLPITQADLPWLVARFKDMNAMLARGAAAHGATYVDIYTSSIGHDACQVPPLAWVNGAVLVPPSYPAHPNQLGQMQASYDVAAAILARRA
jgi:lysophospholipase L1-like esterase